MNEKKTEYLFFGSLAATAVISSQTLALLLWLFVESLRQHIIQVGAAMAILYALLNYIVVRKAVKRVVLTWILAGSLNSAVLIALLVEFYTLYIGIRHFNENPSLLLLLSVPGEVLLYLLLGGLAIAAFAATVFTLVLIYICRPLFPSGPDNV